MYQAHLLKLFDRNQLEGSRRLNPDNPPKNQDTWVASLAQWISASCWGRRTNTLSLGCRGWEGTGGAWPAARHSLSGRWRHCSWRPGRVWCQTSGSPTCTRLHTERKEGGGGWSGQQGTGHGWPQEWQQFELDEKPLTEHPYVTGGGEAPEVDGLRSHPLNRKFAFRCYQKNKTIKHNFSEIYLFKCSW